MRRDEIKNGCRILCSSWGCYLDKSEYFLLYIVALACLRTTTQCVVHCIYMCVCVCVFSTDGAPDRGLCSRPLQDTLWQFPARGASERQSWQRRRMSPSVTPDACTAGTPPNPRRCAEDSAVHPTQLSRYPVSFSKANIWLQKTFFFFPDLTTDSPGTTARRGRRWLNYHCGQSVLKQTHTHTHTHTSRRGNFLLTRLFSSFAACVTAAAARDTILKWSVVF